ncbi:uncharacterized protein LOC134057545 [Cinclus cinclus]|uniref:uncharacterized protein LOC134057545 n=1 Tax=Cinclus cinclus TaxID=127875 RepID=UPI002E12A5B2
MAAGKAEIASRPFLRWRLNRHSPDLLHRAAKKGRGKKDPHGVWTALPARDADADPSTPARFCAAFPIVPTRAVGSAAPRTRGSPAGADRQRRVRPSLCRGPSTAAVAESDSRPAAPPLRASRFRSCPGNASTKEERSPSSRSHRPARSREQPAGGGSCSLCRRGPEKWFHSSHLCQKLCCLRSQSQGAFSTRALHWRAPGPDRAGFPFSSPLG